MNPENIIEICRKAISIEHRDTGYTSDEQDLLDTLQGWWFQLAAMRGMTPIEFSKYMMETRYDWWRP